VFSEVFTYMINVGEFDRLPWLGLKLSPASWTLFCLPRRNSLHKFYTLFADYFYLTNIVRHFPPPLQVTRGCPLIGYDLYDKCFNGKWQTILAR